MLLDIRCLFVVPPMPTIDSLQARLKKKGSGSLLLGLPVSPNRDEEGVNLLLGDSVGSARASLKGPKLLLLNQLVHPVGMHPQLFCSFFDSEVCHLCVVCKS